MMNLKFIVSRLSHAMVFLLSTSMWAESSMTKLWDLELPDPVTSFGACKDGNFLYVYGGHIGDAHVYSKKTHSLSFARLNLKKKKKWEQLPFRIPIQGFGMAAHKGKIFISGGSQATNAEKEESDLSSLSQVSMFDVRQKKWSKLSPLPEPRSSHEMVCHNGKLYLIGGWNMQKGVGVKWHHHGLYADLSNDPIVWKKLPRTEWTVRANSAAVVNEQLYVVGGIDDNGTLNTVHKLDLSSMKWITVKDFPSTNRLKAFGSASVNLGGNLLVGSFSYQPRVFLDSNLTWMPTMAKVKEKRFFHRLVPLNETKVLFVGGASWEGHLNTIEELDFSNEVNPLKIDRVPNKKLHEESSWPGFRGSGNSKSKSINVPLKWSDEQNLLWKKDLDGYGQSTPVVFGNRIFTTSTEGNMSEKLLVHCHLASHGELLWKKSFQAPVEIERSQYVSQAAPSPVVDSKRIYVFFESGKLLAMDHDGEVLWDRTLTDEYGPFEGNHGVGSSLFQSADSLGLLIDHAGPSYLLKIDKATGQNSWKIDRKERVSWSTPTLGRGENEVVYISSNGVVQAFDFSNGQKIWESQELEGNTVASPTLTEQLVIIGSSKEGFSMAFNRLDLSPSQNRVSWNAQDATCSFSSPLATDSHVYFVNRAGVATCHNLLDGKKIWNLRLAGSCWASSIHVASRIYFFTKDGVTIVLKDNGEEDILAENKLSISGKIYGVGVCDNGFVMRTGTELLRVGIR
tara:strand:- start:72 stop:2279 length:2208 start_codon:yes stop_codon:yes gene_type:complete